MTYNNVACAMHSATSAGLLAPSLDLKPIPTAQERFKQAVKHQKQLKQSNPHPHPFALYNEAKRLFNTNDAIAMNFVPQMVRAYALHECLTLCDYCAKRKIKEVKEVTRALRTLLDRYAGHLVEAFGQAIESYRYYRARYADTVQLTMIQTQYTVGNVVNKMYPDCIYRELAARTWIVHSALLHAEKIDRKWDVEIDRRFGRHIPRRTDRALVKIIQILSILEGALFAPLSDNNESINTCMRTLENQANRLVTDLIDEEQEQNEAI